MVLVAKEDTYGMEDVGGGVMVRRIVAAHQPVPAHYEVEGKTEEVERSSTGYQPVEEPAEAEEESAHKTRRRGAAKE